MNQLNELKRQEMLEGLHNLSRELNKILVELDMPYIISYTPEWYKEVQNLKANGDPKYKQILTDHGYKGFDFDDNLYIQEL
jgi:hypothetical protein